MADQTDAKEREESPLLHHDSAVAHVTGKAVYIDDMDFRGMLYGLVVYSKIAKGTIRSIETDEALSLKGVIRILTAKDIPGVNQMGPVIHDELCLAIDRVEFIGQAIALIAAENEHVAYEAAKLISVEIDSEDAITTLEEAIEADNLITTPKKIITGNIEQGFKDSDFIIEGSLKTGAQEHWYLETQAAVCVPGEGTEIKVFSSTQHPSETQAIVAEVLGLSRKDVMVETRRLGGGFGGKETQANHVAAWAALMAYSTHRPVKMSLFRDDDQIMTGKRHRFLSNYKVGFSKDGQLQSLDAELNSDVGAASDLSVAILERALFHIDNAYFIPNLRVVGKAYKTNLPSNTAFRGFGGPQGMAVIEEVIDRIARFLKKDTLEIRKLNFYRESPFDITHYGQKVENNRLSVIYDKLIQSSDYLLRKSEIDQFNEKHRFYKKGIALTPVKFGISFTASFLNQAGALVNIYQDGTVLVSHGGTEMGQGLNTKILAIASQELGISSKHIKIHSTNTSVIPNTSATAASSGSDLNGMAVRNAIQTIKLRLTQEICKVLSPDTHSEPEDFIFRDDHIHHISNPERKIKFTEVIQKAYMNRISLSSTGYYSTPDVYYDREIGKGHPFYYFAFGMAVSEVTIDTLTGESKLNRVDILHDAGSSLNEKIDLGQVYGALIQGLGWITTEEIKWNKEGKLLTYSPDTYKIPTIGDIPKIFNVELLKGYAQPGTIGNSKAVGEPPFMLAFSVWMAIKYAVSAVANHQFDPDIPIPATAEAILLGIEKISKNLKI